MNNKIKQKNREILSRGHDFADELQTERTRSNKMFNSTVNRRQPPLVKLMHTFNKYCAKSRKSQLTEHVRYTVKPTIIKTATRKTATLQTASCSA